MKEYHRIISEMCTKFPDFERWYDKTNVETAERLEGFIGFILDVNPAGATPENVYQTLRDILGWN